VAYLLAYLFNPVVAFMNERFRVPRWASSLVATGLIIGIVASIAFLLIPSLINQLEVLGGRIVEGVSGLRSWLDASPLLDRMQDAGILDKQEFIGQVIAAIQEQGGVLASGVPEAAQQVARGLGSILGLVTVLAIMPVVVFYTLKDFAMITDKIIELFPTFGGRREYLVKAGGVVGNYLRGQLMISAIAAFNVSVLLLIFDVPFALLIGLLGGLLNMIPNVGAILTNVIGIIIAVVFGDPWFAKALIVFLVLLGESLLESSVLTPHILSHQVGLHPVLIVLSLFVFGAFMGLFGLFIAVPVTALIVTAYQAFRQELQFDISGYMRASAD
ncbi:MAG: AI-2E family transporter, partial [Rhodothermales bacterium]|nr:AI-2E family transporter [Rhodothermales bacterium]